MSGAVADIFKTGFETFSRVPSVPPAQGGSGIVVQCTSASGDLVAIKILTGDGRAKLRRFRREIDFCRRVEHANIISVLDHGLTSYGGEERPFYVMPFYDLTLRDVIKDRSFTVEQRLSIFGQVLEGVAFLHGRGCFHRDLKPENVLLGQETLSPVIADFGVAHLTEDLLLDAEKTRDQERLANFVYAAPEQRIAGEATRVTPRADIYALGLILNELFTGEVPHGEAYRTIGSIVPDLALLDALVARMRQQDPLARPADAREVVYGFVPVVHRYAEERARAELAERTARLGRTRERLVENPVQITSFAGYRDGALHFGLNYDFHKDIALDLERWEHFFKNPTFSKSGWATNTFRVVGRELRVIANNEDQAEKRQGDAYALVADANREYAKDAEKRARELQEAERERLEAEARERDMAERIRARLTKL